MALEYTNLKEHSKWITLLLKGIPGSGKTWLCTHLKNAVIINFDNNLSGAIRKLPDEVTSTLKVVNPRQKEGKTLPPSKVYDNFINILTEIGADPTIKVIVIDSLTTMAEQLMYKITGSNTPNTKVEIQHYGDFTRYMKYFGDKVLCADDLDKHIIFTAHEQLIIDKLTDETTYTLNMVTRMKDAFDLYFTDCWRTSVKSKLTGDPDYIITTMPGSNFRAKCSLDLPKTFKFDDQKEAIVKAFS